MHQEAVDNATRVTTISAQKYCDALGYDDLEQSIHTALGYLDDQISQHSNDIVLQRMFAESKGRIEVTRINDYDANKALLAGLILHYCWDMLHSIPWDTNASYHNIYRSVFEYGSFLAAHFAALTVELSTDECTIISKLRESLKNIDLGLLYGIEGPFSIVLKEYAKRLNKLINTLKTRKYYLIIFISNEY
jgi:hypothetical protein